MLIQIYPTFKKVPAADGYYLEDSFLAKSEPLLFANFVCSLDGRIATKGISSPYFSLPRSLTTKEDLRFFLELGANADCFVTHGGYMRAIHDGRLENILNVGEHPLGEGLAKWREKMGLSLQPSVAVCSRSLDFPIPPSLSKSRLLIFTTQGCSEQKKAKLLGKCSKIEVLPDSARVTGISLRSALIRDGFRRIYLCAGPELFESCLQDGCVDVLYLTLMYKLIGGANFLSILKGDQIDHDIPLELGRAFCLTTSQDQLFLTLSPKKSGRKDIS